MKLPDHCEIKWDEISELANSDISDIYCGCDLTCHEDWPDNYYYQDPAFNPNNLRQMAYIRDETNGYGCNREIRIFDFCTGNDRHVIDSACGFVSWSRKDWILFTGYNSQIWKVKSNGDSLTQLTSAGHFNNDPTWNPKGDRFLFFRQSGSNPYACLADENGNILDTLEQLNRAGLTKWPKDDLIIGVTGQMDLGGPFQYFPSTDKLELIDELDHARTSDSVVMSVVYLASEHAILWQTPSTIAKTSIDSKVRTTIFDGAGINRSIQFWGMTVSPDEEFIITQRRDKIQVSDCVFKVHQSLHRMDMDGSAERKLLNPE